MNNLKRKAYMKKYMKEYNLKRKAHKKKYMKEYIKGKGVRERINRNARISREKNKTLYRNSSLRYYYKSKTAIFKRQKERYHLYLKKGVCVNCGKPLDNNKYQRFHHYNYCVSCGNLERNWIRKKLGSKEKRYEQTTCVVCNISIIDRDSTAKYCVSCAKQVRDLFKQQGMRAKEAVEYLKKRAINYDI
jgi:hypothetical protein